MVYQWGFFGSISAICKIWSLTANSRSLQAAALKGYHEINPNGQSGKGPPDYKFGTLANHYSFPEEDH